MKKTLEEIAKEIEGELSGSGDVEVFGVSSAEDCTEGLITYAVDSKYLSLACSRGASCVIVPKTIKSAERPIIRVDNPKAAFVKLLSLFSDEPSSQDKAGIHPNSFVAHTARVGRDVFVGPGAVVDDGAILEDRVKIYPNAYIGVNAKIGMFSTIYQNVVISADVEIGRNVVIHPGSVIGADGFGYIKVEDRHIKIPQNGTVVIEDDVEIGSLVCIDRATIGKTIIGQGTKIDNLVQIGHNVKIGRRCIIVSQVGISGSVVIEDDVVLAGQSGVSDHIRIGKRSIVAARAGVTKDVGDDVVVSGFPARAHWKELQTTASLSKLPDVIKRIRRLEKILNAAYPE
jgi:UDP-3-O-[3-hydroxymyristoyl] glucosamine N-acyltransferase